MVRRYGLRDDQWEQIATVLPGRAGTVGVTAQQDNRLFVEAVLYRYRAGIAWRELPERFGDWNATRNIAAVRACITGLEDALPERVKAAALQCQQYVPASCISLPRQYPMSIGISEAPRTCLPTRAFPCGAAMAGAGASPAAGL
jgi:transposase